MMKNYDEKFSKLLVENKKQIIIFISILLLTIIFMVIIVLNLPNNREITYNSTFSGKVVSISEYKGSLTIKLNNKNKCYLEKATNYELIPKELKKFLAIGDSVYKPINCDSLFIYRNGDEFLFILGCITLNKP